jgi:hypothetical protein
MVMRNPELFLLGVALACLPTTQALAQQNWSLLGSSQGGSLYYDATSVTRDGTTVRVWVKREPARQDNGIAYFVSQAEIDCDRRMAHIIYTASYNEAGAVVERDQDPVPAEPIPPGTFFDGLRERVC